ncbi:response regulator [Sneathiella sp.]|uniref:response regulator n=1 Tax=Sneathiella sp. TaxID=1964365 RepID=UPI00356A1F27
MNKGTVLTVDDDEGLQSVLKQYLEGDGYTVVSARNGAQLSDRLDAVELDVILLDLVLPDADGVNLISLIKSKTQAPIVVVSGKNDTTEKIICLEMGADDYITKPFEMRELSARIKAALRRVPDPVNGNEKSEPAKKQNEKIAVGEFVLDNNQFQVFDKKGKSLDLTTGEFQLLKELALAPRRTLSRERLFELTRDGEFDGYDRVIDIQVGRIRKKLGKEGVNIIKTVRGIGYMFAPKE